MLYAGAKAMRVSWDFFGLTAGAIKFYMWHFYGE